jgi:hypothetical protein
MSFTLKDDTEDDVREKLQETGDNYIEELCILSPLVGMLLSLKASW